MTRDYDYSRTEDVFVNENTGEELHRPIGINPEQETAAQLLEGRQSAKVTTYEHKHSGRTRNGVIIAVVIIIGMFFVMQYMTPTGFMNPDYGYEYDTINYDYDDGDGVESYYYDNETDSWYSEPPPPEDYEPTWISNYTSKFDMHVSLGTIVKVDHSRNNLCEMIAYNDLHKFDAGQFPALYCNENNFNLNGQPNSVWLQLPRPTKGVNYHHSSSKGIDYYESQGTHNHDTLKDNELIYIFIQDDKNVSTTIGVNETPTVLSKIIYLQIAIRKGHWAGSSFQDMMHIQYESLYLDVYNWNLSKWVAFYDLKTEFENLLGSVTTRFEGMNLAIDLTNPPVGVECTRISNSFFSVYSDSGYTDDFIDDDGYTKFRIRWKIDYERFVRKRTVVPVDGRDSWLKFEGAHFPDQSGMVFGNNNMADTAAMNFWVGWVGMQFDTPKETRAGIYIQSCYIQTKYDLNRV